MSNLPLNKTFLRQFRDNQMVYSMQKPRSYQSLNYRQFCGNQDEMRLLYKGLSRRLNDENLAQKLTDRIVKEVIPHARRMSGFVNQFKKNCLANAKHEPFTLPYYSPLIIELKTFASLIEQFEKIVPTQVMKFLNGIRSEKTSGDSVQLYETEKILNLRQLTRHYLDLFREVQGHFFSFLRKESPEEHAIMLYSRIGANMMHLLNLTENLIGSAREILHMLEKWEIRLKRRETQEIYN
jgi:hypothetical protein